MLAITELLDPTPVPLWRIVKQAGVDQVVSLLDGAEQQWRWPKAGAQHLVPGRYVAPPPGERPWERPALKRLQDQYREYGLEVVVIEDTAPMDDVRLGRPGRDEQIEWFCTQLKAMGELGIPTLCYNWVAITSWPHLYFGATAWWPLQRVRRRGHAPGPTSGGAGEHHA